jgi:hypothetical protein
VPCDTVITGTGNQGQYEIDFTVGTTTGAIIVVFNPLCVPDRCQWSFDYDNSGVPTVASEYSSSQNGYMQGIIGWDYNGTPQYCYDNGVEPALCNSNGSNGLTYSGTRWLYNPVTNVFDNTTLPVTMGPYTNAAAGGTTIFSAPTWDGTGLPLPPGVGQNCPGNAMMVIPKPNVNPGVVNFLIDGPFPGTVWTIRVNCPVSLNRFPAGTNGGACGTMSTFIYTAHVWNTTGLSSSISVNDWVFTDINGENQHPAGVYPVQWGGNTYCVTISADSVVTNIAICAGTC